MKACSYSGVQSSIFPQQPKKSLKILFFFLLLTPHWNFLLFCRDVQTAAYKNITRRWFWPIAQTKIILKRKQEWPHCEKKGSSQISAPWGVYIGRLHLWRFIFAFPVWGVGDPDCYDVFQSLFCRNFQRCDLTLVYSVYSHFSIETPRVKILCTWFAT